MKTLEQRIARREYLKRYYAQNKDKLLAQHRAWVANNHDKYLDTMAEWRRNNRDKISEYQRVYLEKNPESRRASQRAWNERNPEKVAERRAFHNPRRPKKLRRSRPKMTAEKYKESALAANRRWVKNNPDKARARSQRRRAIRRNQLHPCLDQVMERELFVLAQKMTRETGVPHHVDHIIPFKHGGWHHHLNLQVLPCRLNLCKKHNPFWSCSGFKSWRDVPEYLWPEQLAPAYRSIIEKEKSVAAN